ncbi:hypothetical protein [Thalassotalea montiporae]
MNNPTEKTLNRLKNKKLLITFSEPDSSSWDDYTFLTDKDNGNLTLRLTDEQGKDVISSGSYPPKICPIFGGIAHVIIYHFKLNGDTNNQDYLLLLFHTLLTDRFFYYSCAVDKSLGIFSIDPMSNKTRSGGGREIDN